MSALSIVTSIPYNKICSHDDQNSSFATHDEGVAKEPKELLQNFILEQFDKLSLQGNLGLNSKVKRTFARP